MASQWHCLLQNLGVWQGSFARLSPEGAWEETPTIVSLECLDNNQMVRQIVRRYAPVLNGMAGDLQAQVPIDEKVLEYTSLGRGVLFFEHGAFSQGSMQFSPVAEFGAELGLMAGDRRLRLVQLFDRGCQAQLTLIREQRLGSDAAERPPLTLEALIGEWHGEAVTLYPDWRPPTHYSTCLQISRSGENQVMQTLTFGEGAGSTVRSTAIVAGSRLKFNQGTLPVQVLLLPDGASSTSPVAIQAGQPFFLEVGWLLQPDQRQRLIRSYDSKGAWISLTLVKEQIVSS